MTITTGGLYEISMAEYHSGKACDGPSISASGLWKMLDCPARYWCESPLNPHAEPVDTEALEFGRAVHAWAFGDEEFKRRVAVSPFDTFASKDAKKWRAEAVADDKIVLKQKTVETIKAMGRILRADPYFAASVRKARPELTLAHRDEETGVWLLIRPDMLPHDEYHYTKDYKTAASVELTRFSRAAFDHGYHVKMALAMDVIEVVTGKRPAGAALIAQEKKPPYLVGMFAFDAAQLAYGRKLYRRALRLFADCLHRNEWPGYATDPQNIETPYRIRTAMENETNEHQPANDDADSGRYLAAG